MRTGTVLSIVFWGMLFCVPAFIQGDEAANTPVAPSPVPNSGTATNQSSGMGSGANADAGSFSVNFPAPVTHDTKELDTPMGNVTGILTSCTTETGFFGVCYGDFPVDKSIANLPAFYQKTLTDTVKEQHLQLFSQSACKAGEIEGLEYIANFPTANAVTHVRMFLVGHRSYQVVFTGAVGSENSTNALNFLNSFRLIPTAVSASVVGQPSGIAPSSKSPFDRFDTNQNSNNPAAKTTAGINTSDTDTTFDPTAFAEGLNLSATDAPTELRNGAAYFKYGEYLKAFPWFKKAAEQGYAPAQSQLGICYATGEGVDPDAVEAANWYGKAADQGDSVAEYNLGICYANGIGVEKDLVTAAEWLRKAADQGNPWAQYDVGVCYRGGIGVQEDAVEATKWYRKAADQGFPLAQFTLGACYFTGTGVEKDPVEAHKWTLKAAEGGYTRAQLTVGFCYSGGLGVKKSWVEAVNWYRKAADQGDTEAQRMMGSCYEKGTGVEKDTVEGMRWYRKAADQGDAEAQRLVGLSYFRGSGVENNPTEAVKWLRKAAEQGNVSAQGQLGLFFIQGLGVIKNEVEGLAWLYVSSAGGNEAAAKIISEDENIYNATLILAARQRATELQAQIASHSTNAQDNSVSVTLPPVPVSNMPKESGSGALISADGWILTAAHVVQGASRIEVVTAAGKLAATLVKIDNTNDVALLKCSGSNFTPLPIGASDAVRVGRDVFTIGFPNPQIQGFDPKLTKGEISSLNGMQDDPRNWQISVPIQPGNSGGPLCDENGNLIGIVEATLNPLTMAKFAGEIPQNVNYAVKSSYVLPLLNDVRNVPPPAIRSNGATFEDVVGNVQKSVVFILAY